MEPVLYIIFEVFNKILIEIYDAILKFWHDKIHFVHSLYQDVLILGQNPHL